ncbi:MAG: hypothetical protein NT018_09580 [Armatimonadetes bacterium]|nr:hypothetical protein [Armatimonadota bacterium]
MQNKFTRIALACLAGICLMLLTSSAFAVVYPDNETQYSNQDPLTETRRSDHYRMVFGHYDRDGANAMSEQFVQGNLQMHELCWNRWVNELGMHNINESVTHPEMGLRKANFNFLMTWDDGGGGGAYMSMDANGFSYAMSNPANCRYDPPVGRYASRNGPCLGRHHRRL